MSVYVRGTGKTGRRNSDDVRFMASKGRFAVALPQWASDAITEMSMQMGVTRCRLVCEWVLERQREQAANDKAYSPSAK
jgi:hypothetical protein